jgi:hypothetical protein
MHWGRATCLGLLVTLAAACTSPAERRAAELKSESGGAEVQVLVDRPGLISGVYSRSDERRSWPCFVSNGGGQGGGTCMTLVGDGVHPGWAVEIDVQTFGTDVLFVATDPRVAIVRVPRKSGGTLDLIPRAVKGMRQRVRVSLAPLNDLDLAGNTVKAYDAGGRLLGTTHNCEGLGGPADCGPYDGLIDKTMRRPSTAAR